MAKRCAGGFPDRGDQCDSPPGPRNPVWCDACDVIRMEHLDGQMKALAEKFGMKPSDERR